MAENKVIERELGAATSYAYAVEQGYTGTEEEFAKEQANFAKNAQKVAEDRAAVEKIKTDTQDIKEAAVKEVGDAKNAAITSIGNTASGKLTAIQTAGSAQVEAVQDAGALEVEDVENAGAAERASLGTAAEEKTAEAEARIEAKGAEVLATIQEEYTETYQRALRNESRISRNEKRITNLEQGITPDPYHVDDTVAYSKDVPANALPFAEVSKVGGMTRKCTNLIPFPYTRGGAGYDSEINGMKINVLNDGGIAFSGTPTGYVGFVVYDGAVLFKGEQVISLQGTFSGIYAVLYLYDSNKSEIAQFSLATTNKSVKLNMGSYPSAASMNLTIARASTGTMASGTVYPMLNSGSEAMPYEPYFEGLRSAPVTEVESVGANIWDEEWYNESLDENTGEFAPSSSNSVSSKNFTPVNQVTQYYTNVRAWIAFYTENKTFISAQYSNVGGFITPANCRFIKFQLLSSYGTVYKNDIIVSKGTTAMPYTPYTRNTLPIPEAVQAMDGYGWGTNDRFYNYVDWEQKQFIKRVDRVDMGSLAWKLSGSWFYAPIVSWQAYRLNAICSMYTQVLSTSSLVDKTYTKDSNGNIYLMDTDYTDAATFKAAMSGVMLYYELETPVITDISDLLTEDNYIPVEGGGTVTMVNEYGFAVPSEITYALKEAE